MSCHPAGSAHRRQTVVEIASDPKGAKAAVAENAQQLIAEHFTMQSVSAKHVRVLSALAARRKVSKAA